MPIQHQWDYIFAIGIMFAALDAYNIGANDVANSFATSVASGSLTLAQACLAAAVMEFLGAVLVGARVAGTVKNGIIAASAFKGSAGVQLLAFTCALVCSASWLMIATRYSWPVSTTYSIISALAGVGVAMGGKNAVQWGWNDGKGLATIFAGFIIAPGIAAGFGAIVYLLTKYFVLVRQNSVRAGLIASPVYFFGVTAILTLSIVFKGAPSLNLQKLSESETAAAVVGTAAVIMLLSIIFWLPYVHAKVVKKDYTVRFWHFFIGPLLWFRKAPADAEIVGSNAIPDYAGIVLGAGAPKSTDIENPGENNSEKVRDSGSSGQDQSSERPGRAPLQEIDDPHPIVGPWILPRNLFIIARYKALPFLWKAISRGATIDVHSLQTSGSNSKDAERIRKMHIRAKQFDNNTEHLYSFLQVMTACTASFAHGSNDVSNAIGPFAAIYHVWSTGTIAGKDSNIPVWILVFGGAMIVIGLSTYGYNIMRVIGNRLTFHSPSRGFSMELGAAITVVLASQYGIPVSTTMCITGSTLGVALCNGDIKTFNWRGLGWIVLGWILTVPVVGTLAGCLMGIILNAPHF